MLLRKHLSVIEQAFMQRLYSTSGLFRVAKMPTVIMLDTSLSMSKYVDRLKMATDGGDLGARYTKRDLSHLIVRQVVDHISKTDMFDHIALVSP